MQEEWRQRPPRHPHEGEHEGGRRLVEESADLLELLRSRGDLDFPRESVAVLAEAVMEAEGR